MWNDNETKIDLLGFDGLVDTASGILSLQSLLPTTLGVFGDWGSGKSSLMDMLSERMSQQDAVVCLKFNGWLFEGYEDAKTALMGSILHELKKQQGIMSKAGAQLSRLAKRVDWFRLLSFTTKQAISFSVAYAQGTLPFLQPPSVDDVAAVVKDKPDETFEQSIQEFRKDFADLLDKAGIKALVIFIDDLDRCLPERVIETLEAIKLFLAVPKSAFVIGADERIIRHAIAHRYGALETPANKPTYNIGRDYLEKIIQFPMRIPVLNAIETETFLNLLFCQSYLQPGEFAKVCEVTNANRAKAILDLPLNIGIIKDSGARVSEALDSALSLVGRIAPVLCSHMSGNPRQIKRFMNTLMLRKLLADTRKVALNIAVLAKLMMLEYFDSDRFNELFRWQASAGGISPEIAFLESGEKPKSKKTDIEEETKAWETDQWAREWVKMEPLLASLDLGPYFYFSREAIVSPVLGVRRLSQHVQQVLAQLLSESEAEQKLGLAAAKGLELPEAVALLENLADRFPSAANKERILDSLVDLVREKHDLISRFCGILKNFPVSDLSLKLPMQLAGIWKDSKDNSFEPVLKAWAVGDSSFANAAAAALKRKAN